jgi:hypothetical protein
VPPLLRVRLVSAASLLGYMISTNSAIVWVYRKKRATYSKIIEPSGSPEGSELATWKTELARVLHEATGNLVSKETSSCTHVRADEAEHRDVNHFCSDEGW